MRIFKTNRIFLDSETLAEQLRAARQAKGLELPRVAEKLNINSNYLEALEHGEFDKLPDGIYRKNFLKEYALLLGLDYSELLEIFKREAENKPAGQKDLFSRQIAKTRYFLTVPVIIKNIIIVLVVAVCFVYLAAAAVEITAPPDLTIISPADNFSTEDKKINVLGIAEAESQIIINGELVLSDRQGRFVKGINLKSGVNIITITAKKKYGRKNIIERKILVKDQKGDLQK